MTEYLKEHPFIDSNDFTHVQFFSTKWEDDVYDLYFSMVKIGEKVEDDLGIIFRPNLYGDSLEELSEKLETLLDLGMFDDLTVLTEGPLYDKEGNNIGEINWEELKYINILETNGYSVEKIYCDCPNGVCTVEEDDEITEEEVK